MGVVNRNNLWATIVAEELYRSGVRTICASPGSRSAPLITAFAAHPHLEVLVHIDERSGSFFALGHAKQNAVPVALLCTSGTAAANYYPAAIEAFYSGIPLVILTADRPPALRSCGAGQTIDQIELYGNYTRFFFEVGVPGVSEFQLRHLRSLVSHAVAVAIGATKLPAGPVHLNFAFADPLAPIPLPNDVPADLAISSPLAWYGRDARTDSGAYNRVISGKTVLGTEEIAAIAARITNNPKGVIVVGVYDAPSGFNDAVKRLAEVTGYPLLVEATGCDRRGAIGRYDSFLRSRKFASQYAPELIIRFGAMPTSKAYLLWLEQHIQCHQIIVGNGDNTDPTHGLVQFVHADTTIFCEQVSDYLNLHALPGWQDKQWRSVFEQAEAIAADAIDLFLASVDVLFEGKVYAELAKWLPDDVCIYIGSSMPIRDLDTFLQPQQRLSVLANRGANGIDGTVSSALGAAWRHAQPAILICGDLAFYHDLNGLMATKQFQINLTIILIDNNGGGIFELLPISNFEPPFEQYFATPHGLDFAPIVTAYGCGYTLVEDWQHFKQLVLRSLTQTGTQVIEIKSDRKRDKQLRQELWQSAIAQIDKHLI
ncbi:2-succinyl-5-enolpyruvyl-6-hydroxy-3-cyclohexene-1-carboxylic-acid synthase [Pseudanabaena sp. PCC 6802]|uniref:2-succinyl-5-enolpyruvyl-6-hydroxy-3- cyclohexene-1-carboxylic-acid synthase n=1 Tax=Pseudanabaena sp. PCC 6802 TaxID=118173 RepID=UPI00034C9986|nr:2-succinyl-5-enolpyruvyl-6-hydroxy-3-cyclohexene-1-carboxylic-acid synthase [Pseudanabaena sp. PCC 6802]